MPATLSADDLWLGRLGEAAAITPGETTFAVLPERGGEYEVQLPDGEVVGLEEALENDRITAAVAAAGFDPYGWVVAWARDERSFEVLKERLGDRFDPTRHRVGVDVAFGLPSHPPAKLPTSFDESGGEPPVGLNVSGLIYNDPNAARERYRFVLDYRELVARFVRWLIEERGARVTLVPHVVPGGDVVESDPRANRAVLKELGDFGGRLSLLPEGFDQCETKWLISRCAWFCGTRMHSTIAGLSSGTRTATVSYSPKALGVFESCGLGEAVVDPTSLSTDEALERLRSIYDDRERLGGVLQERLPAVLATADAQMDEIADAIASKAGLRRKGAAAAGAVEAGSAPA